MITRAKPTIQDIHQLTSPARFFFKLSGTGSSKCKLVKVASKIRWGQLTEWMAPMRAHASMAAGSSGTIGM